MDSVVFASKLDRLREGNLILQDPGKNELGKQARQHTPDLMLYLAAVENGYRALQDRLSAYRGQAKGKTLGQMVKNQWSAGACLGYAAMALIQAGNTPEQVVGYLELMEEFMGQFDLRAAAEYHGRMKDGGPPILPEDFDADA